MMSLSDGSTSATTLRRLARQTAVQILYGWDSDLGATVVADWHEKYFGIPRDQRDFVLDLIGGVRARLVPVDLEIQACLQDWTLARLGQLERSILRLGAYEILYETHTPAAVVITEAIELARMFCEPESIPLVHGVLDAIGKRRLLPSTPTQP